MTPHARTKAGLYKEPFSHALRLHAALPVRSEKQEKLSDLFVDNQQLSLIQNPDWQVIYGRRGTGKTMLLGVLRERIDSDFEQSRILAVSVTAQDLLVSPPALQVTDHQRALAYFQVFLETISEQIVKRADELLGSPTVMQRLTLTRKRLYDKIQDTAIQILFLVQTGHNVEAYSTRRETREHDHVQTVEQDASLEAGTAVGEKSASLMAKVSAKLKGTKKKSEKSKTTEALARVPRFALARAKIVELLSLLQVKRLDILIDEWQTLDPHASTGIQSEFAEYLKRTFFGIPQVSVKIATNRYLTRFSNKGAGAGYRGLEVGADIFEATNLDRTEQSLPDQVHFYSTLIYRRLVHCESKLAVFDSNAIDVPDPQFILSIFRDQGAFEELVKGAAATPRDFLLLFNALARARGFTNDPTWTVGMVHELVRQGGANLQEETDPTSQADQLLTKCIKAVVETTGSRLFLVDRDDRYAVHNALEELIEKRLVDSYARADLNPDVRIKYDAFLVHYGLWLDWRHIDAAGQSRPEVPLLQAGDARRFKIKADEIDSDVKTCPHCGDHFSSQARSFHMAGLCPQCFKPFAPVSGPAPTKAAAAQKRPPRKHATPSPQR